MKKWSGEKNGKAKVTKGTVITIRKLYQTGKHTQREIGEMFGVTSQNVSLLCTRKTWTHV